MLQHQALYHNGYFTLFWSIFINIKLLIYIQAMITTLVIFSFYWLYLGQIYVIWLSQ